MNMLLDAGGTVANLTQESNVKSPLKYQSSESGVLRYPDELATNLPLAPPNLLCEVSIDTPPFDVITFGVNEDVKLDVVLVIVNVIVELETVVLVVVVVVFVVCDTIVNV
jgi:hypothetical protein